MSATSRYEQEMANYENQLEAYKTRVNQVKELAAMAPQDAAAKIGEEVGNMLGAHLLTKGVGNILSKGKSALNKAKEAADQKVQDAKNAVQDKVDQVKGQIEDKVSEARGRVQDAQDEVTSRVDDATTKLQEGTQELGDTAADSIPTSSQVTDAIPTSSGEIPSSALDLDENPFGINTTGIRGADPDADFEDPLSTFSDTAGDGRSFFQTLRGMFGRRGPRQSDAPGAQDGGEDLEPIDLKNLIGEPTMMEASDTAEGATAFGGDESFASVVTKYQQSLPEDNPYSMPKPDPGNTSNRIGDLIRQQRSEIEPAPEEPSEIEPAPEAPDEAASRVEADQEANVETDETDLGITRDQAEEVADEGETEIPASEAGDAGEQAGTDVGELVGEEAGEEAGAEAGGEAAAEAGLAAAGAETGGVGFVLAGLVAIGGSLAAEFGAHHAAPPVQAPVLSTPNFAAGLATN